MADVEAQDLHPDFSLLSAAALAGFGVQGSGAQGLRSGIWGLGFRVYIGIYLTWTSKACRIMAF